MIEGRAAGDISVVGMGAMGAALAQCFLDAGKRTIVWNRSPAKAEALRERGAVVASSLAEAIEASAVTIFVVSDAAAVSRILDQAGPLPRERTFVNLSSATPEESKALGERISAANGRYLAGSIMAYPREIGLRDATVLYAGPEAAFREQEGLLSILAGNTRRVGEDWRQAKALSWPIYVQFFTAVSGFFEGAALARSTGMSAQAYAHWVTSTIGPFYRRHITDLARRIDEGDYDGGQATIETEAHAADTMVALLQGAGLDAHTTQAYQRYLRRAVDSGFRDLSVAAVARLKPET